MVTNLNFTIIQITLYFSWCVIVYCIESDKSDFRSRPLWSQTGVDKLKKDLLTNYDKYTRPQEHKEITGVKIGLTIINVETEEAKSVVIVTSMLRLTWNDSKLQWNESEYGNISVMRISDHEIWQPDIYLYNSALGNTQLPRYGNTNVLVYPDGVVLWVPPVKFAALCSFDMTHWPNDVQLCQLKFGSWVYSGNEIVMSFENNRLEATLEHTVSISEWNITTNAEMEIKKYPCCEEVYYKAIYNLTLTRKSASYLATFVAPVVVAVFFILFQFWLPPDASEKILLNGFVFVMLNMFLIHLNQKVVGTGSATPYIVLFYSRCLWVVMVTTLFSILTYCFTKIPKDYPAPLVFQNLLHTGLCKFLYLDFDLYKLLYCKNRMVAGQNDDGAPEERRFSDCDQFVNNLSTGQQWNIILVVVDRMLFVSFAVIFVVLAIIYA